MFLIQNKQNVCFYIFLKDLMGKHHLLYICPQSNLHKLCMFFVKVTVDMQITLCQSYLRFHFSKPLHPSVKQLSIDWDPFAGLGPALQQIRHFYYIHY